MANTYTWKINQLDAKIQDGELQNVIYVIHYNYIAVDPTGEYTASSVSTLAVEYDPETPFIPYDELTKEDVVSWLEAGIDVNILKEALDKQINLQINPVNEYLHPDWN
jgi:hypothetical protein